MIHNYIKAAVRSLLRRKVQTLISIAGLTTGLLCCIMIGAWVRGELSYDRFHENADQIYRVIHSRGMLFPCAMAAYMQEHYPEIENTTRLHRRQWQVSLDDRSFVARVDCVDPSFLGVFSFDFVQGNPKEAISSPNTIVITQSMAQRLFGEENAVGRELMIGKRLPLTVSGVLEDTPFNSHLEFDGLVNFGVMRALNSWYPEDDSWTDGDLWVYVQVKPDADIGVLRDRIQELIDERFPAANVDIILQPITGIHLHGTDGGAPAILYVYIFIGAAVLILLSACVNYINLSTARAGDRAREVGIRKVVGAGRSHLIWQFMGETVIVAFSALFLALGLMELIRPQFNVLVGREIAFDLFGDPVILWSLVSIVLLTGLIAGLYPSLVLASFRPVKVLRAAAIDRTKGSVLRWLLVVGQATVTVFLLVGVTVVFEQLNFIRHKDLGYDSSTILYLDLTGDIYRHLGAIRNDLDNTAGVQSYTFTNTMLDRSETSTDEVTWESQPDGTTMFVRVLSAGYSFRDVFGIEMAQGRFFSQDFATDLKEGYIINEAAVNAMGLELPIGKRFSCMGQEGRIIGVVKDFNYRSLHHEIQPLVIAMRPDWSDHLAIKVSGEDVSGTAQTISGIIAKHVPDYPIEIQFFKNELDALYMAEHRTARLLALASGLAIFMSCLGTLGLVSYAVRRRTREIGVRKVLGASAIGIVRLISREFIIAVAVACTIAFPLAYMAATRWLQDFAFSVPISWQMLVFPGVLTLLVALATAGFLSGRAARANPVESLRNE